MTAMTAINGDTITTIIAIGGPCGAVFTLGWWLSGRFRQVEEIQRIRTEELAEAHARQLAAHEAKDQQRHAENVERLEKLTERGDTRHEENQERWRSVSVSLAKIGANGRS